VGGLAGEENHQEDEQVGWPLQPQAPHRLRELQQGGVLLAPAGGARADTAATAALPVGDLAGARVQVGHLQLAVPRQNQEYFHIFHCWMQEKILQHVTGGFIKRLYTAFYRYFEVKIADLGL
jgi:hypothetical protein